MAQKYGWFTWTCPKCSFVIIKDTPQGLGISKSNHLRKHEVPLPPRPNYIPRDYEQYPEGICGDMGGDCMNCPLPANMRGECIAAQREEKGYDTSSLERE